MTRPDYHVELEPQNGVAHCEDCKKGTPLEACYPGCHQLLQVLKACGAVDYFRQNGYGLVLRKHVEFVPA